MLVSAPAADSQRKGVDQFHDEAMPRLVDRERDGKVVVMEHLQVAQRKG